MDEKRLLVAVGKVFVGVGALLVAVRLVGIALGGSGALLHPLIMVLAVVASVVLFGRIQQTVPALILVVLGYLAGGLGGVLILLGALAALVGSHV